MVNNPQPAIFISSDKLRDPLERTLRDITDGTTQLEPLKTEMKRSGVPISMIIENNASRGSNQAETHSHHSDLWIALEGETEFLVGGSILNPIHKINQDGTINDSEIRGSDITGGIPYTLKSGDLIFVPAGLPHMHWNGAGVSRLWVVKIKLPSNN